MGKKDDITREFMDDNTYFADFCNYYIYDGNQVLQPEQLHALAPKLPIKTSTQKKKEQVQERDILKYISAKTDDNAAYLIVGIENQSDIDYAMPARNMLYDALQYKHQRQEITRKHRNNKEYDSFVSGFQKNDKMLPVITIVVYFGSKPWDGPMSLHEMLDSSNPHLLKYAADYPLQLIDPHRMDEKALNKFKTNAREVLTFIKYSKNKKKVLELVQEERFKKLDSLAAEVINECTNSHLPLIANKEDDVNMCQAIDEIREDSRNEGRTEGIEIGSINRSKEMAMKLLKKGTMPLQEISELVELPISELNVLQQQLFQN